MAQAGYTPISLYHSTTASAVPTAGNLVNGELALNIADGKLYYKDSGGTVQLLTAAGGGLLGITQSTTPFETSLGFEAGNSTTGVNNTFIGYQAGKANTTGVDNVAVGYQALDSNTTGRNNIAVGSNALGSNTTGINNTAIGPDSVLGLNTTGTDNVAVGRSALGAHTVSETVSIGAFSLFSNTTGANNTAVGYISLFNNTTGADNTAVGNRALLANTTGSSNTAVGKDAGDKITTGTQNVVIGDSAASSGTNDLTTGSNNIVIGYNAAASSATVSNEVTLGNSSITNNRLFGNITLSNGAISGIKTATFNSQTTIGTTSGSITVDWTAAQNQRQTEPTGTITYTFTAPPGPCHLQLLIDSDGTSTAQTINWPGTVTFLGATWAGVNNKKAVINFWYDGTNYFAIGTNQA